MVQRVQGGNALTGLALVPSGLRQPDGVRGMSRARIITPGSVYLGFFKRDDLQQHPYWDSDWDT